MCGRKTGMTETGSNMKKEVVFILGLSRVGSTLLDLTLGSHPSFVGLGEVF